MRNKFLGGKDVGVGDVADVSPIKEVAVVADLEVCLAVLEDLGKLRYRRDVSGSVPTNIQRTENRNRAQLDRTHPKIPAGRSATVCNPPLPLAARIISSAFAFEAL